MHSKLNASDRRWLALVKELDCAVCGAPGPSEAHHIKQGDHFTCIALCPDCHRGTNGWHGTKALWRVRKMEELDALNVTLKQLFGKFFS